MDLGLKGVGFEEAVSPIDSHISKKPKKLLELLKTMGLMKIIATTIR